MSPILLVIAGLCGAEMSKGGLGPDQCVPQIMLHKILSRNRGLLPDFVPEK